MNHKSKAALIAVVALILTIGVVFLGIRFVRAARQAAAPKIEGAWEGTLEVKDLKLRLVLKISREDGVYHATMDSIDQGAKDIPISKFVYNYPSIELEQPQLGATFHAKLEPGASEMSGTFKQGKGSFPLRLRRTAEPSTVGEGLTDSDYAPRTNSDLQGFWKGTLQIGASALRLNLKIAEAADGTFRAELDSVDQGATGLAVTTMTYERPAAHFELAGIGATFDGQVTDGDTALNGTWQQGKKSWPLVFNRAAPHAGEVAAADKNYSAAGKDDLQGHWQGALSVKTIKLHLKVDIAQLPDGTYTGTMTSVDQSPAEIPATSIQYNAPNAVMEWKGIGGTFKGKLENGKLTGTWHQGGGTLALVLERTAPQ